MISCTSFTPSRRDELVTVAVTSTRRVVVLEAVAKRNKAADNESLLPYLARTQAVLAAAKAMAEAEKAEALTELFALADPDQFGGDDPFGGVAGGMTGIVSRLTISTDVTVPMIPTAANPWGFKKLGQLVAGAGNTRTGCQNQRCSLTKHRLDRYANPNLNTL